MFALQNAVVLKTAEARHRAAENFSRTILNEPGRGAGCPTHPARRHRQHGPINEAATQLGDPTISAE
jgi:hypothetical protein